MKTTGKIFVFCCLALAVNAASILRLAEKAAKASPGEFPYQVSIQLDGQHHCGGALISKTHVLTAAHCVHDFIQQSQFQPSGNRIVVEVGSTNINGGQKHAVKRISHERDYDGARESPYFYLNDIAVITLKTPVTESAYVKTVSLPAASSEVPEGTKVVVSGFGSAVVGSPTSPVLQKTEMKISSLEECKQYYASTFQKTIVSSHICTKRGEGYGTCSGDSGGPLVAGKKIVGVVSGGNGVCGSGYPDVFTKVSHHIPYIQYEMNYDFKGDSAGSPSTAVDIDESNAPQMSPPVGFPQFSLPGYNPYPLIPQQPQIGYPQVEYPQMFFPQLGGFYPLAQYPYEQGLFV